MKSTLFFSAIGALAVSSTATPSFAQAGDGVLPNVDINEIRIDQPGGDSDEYFELTGAPNTSLDGLTYIVIGDGAGGSGTIEAVVDLTGNAINANGFFLVAEGTFSLTTTVDLTTNVNFENGDNVTHLLLDGFTGANGDDLDTDDDGTLDVTPWNAIISGVALIEEANPPMGTEFHYGNLPGTTIVGPDGSFVPAHPVLCDGDWRFGSFTAIGGDDTPGAENFCPAETSTFCTALPNSFSATGSTLALDSVSGGSIAANDSSLVVNDTPDQFGLFVQSSSTMAPFTITNGGNLCLGFPDLQRLTAPIMANMNTASYALDFAGTGAESSTTAGMTMYYQWYHRDSTPTPENLSEGLAITWIN